MPCDRLEDSSTSLLFSLSDALGPLASIGLPRSDDLSIGLLSYHDSHPGGVQCDCQACRKGARHNFCVDRLIDVVEPFFLQTSTRTHVSLRRSIRRAFPNVDLLLALITCWKAPLFTTVMDIHSDIACFTYRRGHAFCWLTTTAGLLAQAFSS
jgi:hypothetical protein